jgi:Lrp/AsnC family transcriptional regulator, regulator for asnA, asnC and gidA
MKTSSRTLDDIDIRIARELGKNGRTSNREIARRLKISEGSVRQRVGRLLKSGALRVVAQANLECVPEAFLAVVGLKIDGRRLTACAEKVRALPAVLTTMIVTGRHDLLAVVLAPSRSTLVEFVTNELAALPGIRDSETTVVLRSFGQWVPAERLFRLAGAKRAPRTTTKRKTT